MKDEHGYIVVETVGTFVPFVLLLVSILSLVNIVAVQARMHFALTQAANTISMYSYTLEVLGVAGELTKLADKAGPVGDGLRDMRNDVNAAINGISTLTGIFEAIGRVGSVLDRALGWGGEFTSDPKGSFQNILSYGANELRNKAFEELVRPLVGRYLANGEKTGDEYLKGVGVVNTAAKSEGLEALEFFSIWNFGAGDSVLIDENGNIRLVVNYEIKYTFGGLPLPFSPTLRITQAAVTKAWLNGSGKGYW